MKEFYNVQNYDQIFKKIAIGSIQSEHVNHEFFNNIRKRRSRCIFFGHMIETFLFLCHMIETFICLSNLFAILVCIFSLCFPLIVTNK